MRVAFIIRELMVSSVSGDELTGSLFKAANTQNSKRVFDP